MRYRPILVLLTLLAACQLTGCVTESKTTSPVTVYGDTNFRVASQDAHRFSPER